MKKPPINKALLIHSVKGTPKRLATKDMPTHLIEKVTLRGKTGFNALNPQQSVGGNGIMYWDNTGSTKIDDAMPKFAVGDTIEFVNAPLIPKVCVIANVTPIPDLDGTSIHHLELTLN